MLCSKRKSYKIYSNMIQNLKYLLFLKSKKEKESL